MQQTQTAHETPAPRPVTITTVGADGNPQTISVPTTQAEVDALLKQRSELGDQLSNVTGRRQSLVSEIRNAPEGVARTGIEDRVKVLDQRILQLENDLASTGRLLAAAPSDLVQQSEQPPRSNQGGDDFEEGLMVGGFSVLMFFMVLGAWRRFRRRRRRGTEQPKLAGESDGRLERLERGMEAIAIEIERVSEGQRFVTRLLSESQSPIGRPQAIAQRVGSEPNPAG